jgi:16S rRNA (cytosine1402-N4)-methyltransferase
MIELSQPGKLSHEPVMLAEVLAHLKPSANELHIDGTFGGGGYTRAILEAAACSVLAIDRDPNALELANDFKSRYGAKFNFFHGNFADAESALQSFDLESCDGFVLDIGVSSMQINKPERGFSFMQDGPLDMRMSQQGESAADVVNTYEQSRMANIIFAYGEERQSRRLARAIVEARKSAPIMTTRDLVTIIESAIGKQHAKDKIHPATRTFQALRIHVNKELDALVSALVAAERVLRNGGRLAVVTFHSLEDRIVKQFLRLRTGKAPAASRHLPSVELQPSATFRLPFSGHMSATTAECERNPRARSAKLRVAIRTEHPAWPPAKSGLFAVGLT